MPAFTLAEVAKITGAKILKQAKAEFTDIVTDTRKITNGVLFIAFKGERFNGEDFAGEVVQYTTLTREDLDERFRSDEELEDDDDDFDESEETKFCFECGAENDADAEFCAECGASLS